MLPRRCKKCRCYVAPQLHRCPRCNKVAPPLVVPAQTKEDKQIAREKRDAKVPTLHGTNIHWVPSVASLDAHKQMLDELARRLDKADTARLRNTIRSEVRETKRLLARANVPKGKKAWTSEIFHTKQQCVSVFVAPSGHRYVTADRDGAADLIIVNPKKRRYRGMPVCRLTRFEKSRYAKMKRAEKQEETAHKKRSTVKKKARAAKRAKTKS